MAQLLARWHQPDAPLPLLHTFSSDALLRIDKGERRLTHVAAAVFEDLSSASQAKNALKRGDLLLNGEAQAEGCRRVEEGDTLSLQLSPPPPLSGKKLDSRCRFASHLVEQGMRALYEDDDLAVVFKPAGIHTKSRQNPKFLALEDALPAILSPSAASDALSLPLAMHRLDVRVSGLLVVVKTRTAALSLAKQFEGHTVGKEYEALLVGAPPEETMEIDTPIVVEGAEVTARTTLRSLRLQPHLQWGVLSHVRLSPMTGRTHQLRIHTAALGTPIVGDDKYWDMAVDARELRAMSPLPPVRRGSGLFLQSCAIAFTHPKSGSDVKVEIPAEPKFSALMERANRAVRYESGGETETVERSSTS